MVAVRLLPLEEVEAKLRSLGCRPVEGERLKTAQLWVTPWGHHFFLHELTRSARLVNADSFGDLWDEIERTRPRNH